MGRFVNLVKLVDLVNFVNLVKLVNLVNFANLVHLVSPVVFGVTRRSRSDSVPE